MPIYDWQCKGCSKEIEVERRISENDIPPEKCEQCGSTEFTKLISKGTSFNLEGGGWFSDGY